MDFVHDQYYINGNTTCDGTIGTQYTAGGGNTGVVNFINGTGATFTRAGTTNVTDTNPPFYLDSTQGEAFVSRASVTNNVTQTGAPFYIGTTGNGPSQSWVSRADTSAVATYFDNTGTLQTAAKGAARSSAYYYNGSSWVLGGTLIEPAATNQITNSTMQGAVAADGVERTNNGTFSNTSPAVCTGSLTASGSTFACGSSSIVSQTISSITYSGTTATVVTAASHGLAIGDIVSVTGASPASYNGTFVVASVPTATKFTYKMASSPGVNASPVGSYVATNYNAWAATLNGSSSATVSASAGQITLSGDGTNAASIYEAISTTRGYTYTVAITTGAGASSTIQVGTTVGGAQRLSATSVPSSGTSYYQFTATSSTVYVQINNTSTTSALMTAVSIQSAGEFPTNWNQAWGNNGLVSSVIGTGTEYGIPYIDVTTTGTTTATATSCFPAVGTTTVAASIGQTWTASWYLRLMSGSFSGLSKIDLELFAANSSGVYLGDITGQVSISGVTSAALSTQRVTQTGTTTNVSTAYVNSCLIMWFNSGSSVNFTLRIGMPQLEQSSYATSVIATSGSAVTRAADVYNQQPASYFDSTGTLYFSPANTARTNYVYSGGSWVGGGTLNSPATTNTLIEPAATNSITNNTMQGAVAADGVERTNNGTFSTTSPNVCSGSLTSGGNTLSCNNGTGTGWVGTINGGSGSITAASGSMTLSGDGTNAASIYEAITTVSGYTYNISVTTGAGSAVTVQAGAGVGGAALLAASSVPANGTTIYQFTASGSTSYVQVNNTSNTAAVVTAVSVQSAGEFPTNWSPGTNNDGILAQVIGSGTDSGVSYVDIKVSGTSVATTELPIREETNTAIAAAAGQTWTDSAYLKIVSGSTTGISSIGLVIQEMNSSGTALVSDRGSNILSSIPTSGALSIFRTTVTETLGNAATAYVRPYLSIYPSAAGNSINFTLRIGMPQLEQSSYATSVIPTYGSAVTRTADVYSEPSGGTYYNSAGVIKMAPANTPRLDYGPGGGNYPLGVLIEDSKTNTLPYSVLDGGTNWTYTANNTVGTANAATSPDGGTFAAAVADTTTSASHSVAPVATPSVTSGNSYVFSVFVKPSTATTVQIDLPSPPFQNVLNGPDIYANFNLATGTVVSGFTSSASIQALTNGWYRCSLTASASSTGTTSPIVALTNNSTSANPLPSYSGSGETLYLWGAQFEQGTYPTSYIPTSGSNVNRSVDSFTLPSTAGPGSGWFAGPPGTLQAIAIAPYVATGTPDQGLSGIDDGTTNNSVSLKINNPDGDPDLLIISGGSQVIQQNASSTPFPSYGICDIMAAFQNGAQSVSGNGLAAVDTSLATLPTINRLNIGHTRSTLGPLNGWVNRVTYFPIIHPDASLPGFTNY